ncbi:MAG: hypothetical protein IJZ93_02840 [Clostridia bacterium]|nr:hypothetical protein [Clostridia bacterium]
MKKLFKILLIALCVCALFAFVSCNKGDETTNESSSTAYEETSTDIASEESSSKEDESSTAEEESSRFVEGAGRNEQLGEGWSPFYPSDF